MKTEHDVFLSYNRRDREAALRLAEELERRGLRPWIDIRELQPGRPWQSALQDIVETVPAAAVLVGADGIGPWEAVEMQDCLTQMVQRGLPVIPVLLPGAPSAPALPLGLRGNTWVDLRHGFAANELDRLQWGITDVRPEDREDSATEQEAAVQRATVQRATTPRDAASRHLSIMLAATLFAAAVVGAGFYASRQRSEPSPTRPHSVSTDGALTDTVAPDAVPGMVDFAGGSFEMGSTDAEVDAALAWCRELTGDGCRREIYAREQPVRMVHLSPFRIDVHEVTRFAFAAWLSRMIGARITADGRVVSGRTHLLNLDDGDPESSPGLDIELRDGRLTVQPVAGTRPMTGVTWFGARAFCRGQGKRLPTEAEWEFVARGPERRTFPWSDVVLGCADAVFARRSQRACAHFGEGAVNATAESADRTPAGVLHLGGNVSEWVEDAFVDRYAECPDGCRDPVQETSDSDERVVRGGHWGAFAEQTRAAGRGRQKAGEPHHQIGFRCAQDVS